MANVTVTANAPCILSAWIDFNGNGDFILNPADVIVIGDFNGDKRDDFVVWPEADVRQVRVTLSYGNGMYPQAVWLGQLGFDAGDLLFAGDVNGDHLDDLILFNRTGHSVYVALSYGTGFGAPAIWHQYFAASMYERPRVSDLNGDGRADIIAFGTDSLSAQGDVFVAFSDGASFTGNYQWHDWFAVLPEQIVRIGDYRGVQTEVRTPEWGSYFVPT